MRTALGVLVLMAGSLGARGQDAPLQTGPLPGSVVDSTTHEGSGTAGGYRMEPGMTAPKIVEAAAAEYPKDLPVIVGTVRCTLSMVIDEHGTPLFIRVVHSAGEEFDAAAIYAVRQSKFEAGLREQKAVPIRTMVRVAFTDNHAPALPEVLKSAYRDSGDAVKADTPPKLLYNAVPQYSEEARKQKISGTVLISLLVNEEGVPADVHVVNGLGYGLDEKAVQAVNQYRFKPAMKDGKAIAQHLAVEVSFHIY